MASVLNRYDYGVTLIRRIVALGFSTLIFLSCGTNILPQVLKQTNPSETLRKQNGENPDLTRWKIVVGSLAQESRTVFPEERRPYAMVEVADASWEIDREASRQLYFSALDSALSSAKQDKKNRGLINYVLASATRRDPALAKELNKRLLDEEGDRDNISVETALDLLEENPLAAAQLAEAFAPNGLQDGTAAFLIFSLAKKDIRLSDRVYGVYLNKVGPDENIPLESVLTLAGYAFGNSEYYTVNRRGHLLGSSLPPIPGLHANRVFTAAFLNLAYRRLTLAIERRDRAVGGEMEAMNFPILFASEYLLPEVAKFSPNTLPAWRQLQQRGIVGATTQQTLQIQNHLLQIDQARRRAQKFTDGSLTPELDAEASLENVDKLPGTCKRDVVRSDAALLFASRKNFKRALEIAAKIEDVKQGDSVKEAIAIQIIETAIENGELEEAPEKIGRLSSHEHKARLYVVLAEALGKKNDRPSAQAVVDEAVKVIEKFPDTGDRAAVLFSLSTILLKTDPPESLTVLRNAVKNLNKKDPVDEMSFAIPIKVPLSCPGEEASWYGGFETLPNSNVLNALLLFAKQNPDEATRAADEIGDKVTKIRAHALIARIALSQLFEVEAKPKPKLKASANQENPM